MKDTISHEEVKKILFRDSLNLCEEYLKMCSEINRVACTTEEAVDILSQCTKKLGEENMIEKEDTIEKKFTFTEVMIEMEGYVEDCTNDRVRPIRRYTDGLQQIYIDNDGDVSLEDCGYVTFDRRWYLVE